MNKQIPGDVIARDHELTERAKGAQFDLDRHRWEQCEDPNGPQYKRAEYADACGIKEAALRESINRWAAALAAANPEVSQSAPRNLDQKGTKGGRPKKETTQQVTEAAKAGALEQPTPEQHQAAFIAERHGAEAQVIVAALATAFGLSEVTVGDSKPDWPSRREQVRTYAEQYLADGGVTWEQACAMAAIDVKREVEIRKEHDRARKAKEAAQAEQGGTLAFMEVLAVAGGMAEEGRRLSNISGADSIRWSDDMRDMLNARCDEAQRWLNALRALPMAEQITVENIVGEQR